MKLELLLVSRNYFLACSYINFCSNLADAASVLLAVILMTIQCGRRLYDTHFVSVFGKNSRMDLSHYLLGFIHYAGVFLAILCEAPTFANDGILLFAYMFLFESFPHFRIEYYKQIRRFWSVKNFGFHFVFVGVLPSV